MDYNEHDDHEIQEEYEGKQKHDNGILSEQGMMEMQQVHSNSKVVIQGVKTIAEDLKRCILDVTSSAEIQRYVTSGA